MLLQQANSRLVTSAIEVKILVAKLQIAKNQMDHLAHHDVLTNLSIECGSARLV